MLRSHMLGLDRTSKCFIYIIFSGITNYSLVCLFAFCDKSSKIWNVTLQSHLIKEGFKVNIVYDIRSQKQREILV